MFALATTRNKSFSGDQPIQETHVVCNIVAGVVTLVVACVFAAGWVRSVIVIDVIVIPVGTATAMSVRSSRQQFLCEAVSGYGPYAFDWSDSSISSLEWTNQFEVLLNVQGIPYWSIVIPLILLSAWLLLGKPRTKTE